MKANIKLLRKCRHFTEEFKLSLIKEYESGRFSVRQLGSLHSIKPQVIYHWIHKFSIFNEKGTRIVEMTTSSSKKLNELERKVKELESIVGQKQIQIDYLEKMMEIAKDELDIDIKKNFGTPPSVGSGKTKTK